MTDAVVPTLILAVDDEQMNAELLQRAFRPRTQIRLLSANNADDALKLASENNVSLLLLDQSMPGTSGVQLLRQMRAAGNQTVCIMVTAFPEMKEVVDAWNEGLVRYIVLKPWRASELLTTVDRALSRIS